MGKLEIAYSVFVTLIESDGATFGPITQRLYESAANYMAYRFELLERVDDEDEDLDDLDDLEIL